MSDVTLGPPTRAASVLALAGFVTAAGLVGALASLVTIPAIPAWYAALAKPGWTPPDWLFGPVWTVLYLLMSIAAWLVWRRIDRVAGARGAIRLFWLQLLLNAVWPFLFFGLRRPAWGLIDIGLLLAALLATTLAFWRVRGSAGVLLMPYLLWSLYAASLNLAIWQMNG